MVSFSKGSGYSKGDLKEDGTPIILYGRLYTKYETVISEVDTFVDEKKGSVFSKGGEVIVPASGETSEDISIASVVEKSGVLLGGDLNIITPPDDMDSAFLAISISNGKPHNDMAKMAQGKSVVHLHNSDLEKIDLPYPSYAEQRRISGFFSDLDNLITLHQRVTQIYKENNLINTISWEQRKVQDIYKITRGYVLAAPETNENPSDDMLYPVYSSQTKNNGLMGYYKDYLYEDAITWTTDGANAGTVNYRAGKFYCTNVCGVLLSDEGYANKCAAEALNSVAWRWVSHVGNPKLMNNVMGEISISLPKSIEEQNHISRFLEEIDNLITLHQRKCEEIKEIKKFMLKNMFP